MSGINSGKMINRMNFDQLAKSIERLSLYDSRGKTKLLQMPTKIDFSKLIGNLDLNSIQERM
jgi:hypothetical protein